MRKLSHGIEEEQALDTQRGKEYTLHLRRGGHIGEAVQLLSHVRLFATPGSTPGFPAHHSFLEFAQIHVHWVGDANQPSHSLSPPSLPPSVFPSIRIFSSELALCVRWPKYWSFSICPSNGYSRLISFRIDWFDLLALQGLSTVFSSTTIWKHQFFGAQPSLWSNFHIYIWLLEKNHSFNYMDLCWQSNVSAF